MRAQEILEAFDQPYPMSWGAGEFGDHDALVKLPDGTNLSIMFGQNDGIEGSWHVEFWRNNSQDVSGEGDAQRIFATVLSAIQHFIEEHDPEEIEFTAQKDTDSGEKNLSRSSLYTRLVKRYANSWGYRVDVSDNAGSTYYRLERIR